MLTDQQIARFADEGILTVPDVLPARVLEDVRAEYDDLLHCLYADWQAKGRVDPAKDFWSRLAAAQAAGCDWFQPMDISLPGDRIHADTPFHAGPAVFSMMTHPGLLDLVADLIGPEITSNPIQHVRIKPPATDVAPDEARAHVTTTDWHQDRAVAHPDGDATDMVTVWIAMTDATLDNGCLQAIPRSARMLPHCPRRQTAIADGYIDPSAARALPVPAGGVVLLHPLTPHASRANQSPGYRWSFDLRYHATGQPSGRAHFPHFVARSASDPGSELRDWRTWRKTWQDARARLAGQPHVPIHRWKADTPACA